MKTVIKTLPAANGNLCNLCGSKTSFGGFQRHGKNHGGFKANPHAGNGSKGDEENTRLLCGMR